MAREHIHLYHVCCVRVKVEQAGGKPLTFLRLDVASLRRLADKFPAVFPFPASIPDTHDGDADGEDDDWGEAGAGGGGRGGGRGGGGRSGRGGRGGRSRRRRGAPGARARGAGGRAVRIGMHVHVPCTVFSALPPAAEGFWRGRTVSVAHWPIEEQGGTGDIGVRCEGDDGIFLWARDEVAQWVVKGQGEQVEGHQEENAVGEEEVAEEAEGLAGADAEDEEVGEEEGA